MSKRTRKIKKELNASKGIKFKNFWVKNLNINVLYNVKMALPHCKKCTTRIINIFIRF